MTVAQPRKRVPAKPVTAARQHRRVSTTSDIVRPVRVTLIDSAVQGVPNKKETRHALKGSAYEPGQYARTAQRHDVMPAERQHFRHAEVP